jgi:hypothetical protein
MRGRLSSPGAVWRAALAAACLAVPVTPGWAADSPADVGEYELKAAFLYNFAKFVEWTPEALRDGEAPFRVCLVGEDPFGAVLDTTLEGKTVNGHLIVVSRERDGEPSRACNIAFFAAPDRRRGPNLLERIPPGVLTVGDYAGFAEHGGMIGFVMDGAKVRFEINLEAANKGRMRISSKLLKLARIVKNAADEGTPSARSRAAR